MSQKEPEGFPDDYPVPPKGVLVARLRPLSDRGHLPAGGCVTAIIGGTPIIVKNESAHALTYKITRNDLGAIGVVIGGGES